MTTSGNPTAAENKSRLIEIITTRSFQTGKDMKLASGRTSSLYFNMKPTMLDPEGSFLIGTLVVDHVMDKGVDMIGGLEMGAVPLATAVATVSHMRGQPIGAFFVRKQAKEHGTQSLIEGLPDGETIAGKAVVVIEDVTTTGGSALKAVEQIKNAGGTVVTVLTIVDRLEGAVAAFADAGVPFSALLTADDFR